MLGSWQLALPECRGCPSPAGRGEMASQEALQLFTKWTKNLGFLSQQQVQLQKDCECPQSGQGRSGRPDAHRSHWGPRPAFCQSGTSWSSPHSQACGTAGDRAGPRGLLTLAPLPSSHLRTQGPPGEPPAGEAVASWGWEGLSKPAGHGCCMEAAEGSPPWRAGPQAHAVSSKWQCPWSLHRCPRSSPVWRGCCHPELSPQRIKDSSSKLAQCV